MKTFSGKVVRHSLAYLTDAQIVGGGRPILAEILGQSDTPLQKRRLPIDIRS